ncbi:fructosamine kinase family protein [Methylomarinum sp. Ch1-1]|uniref:Fructosamine kinase family protein n=1 Tax=Methylomarinum roseum TaxID=3067653 RepID=A0AAU7NTJ7_9GAMM
MSIDPLIPLLEETTGRTLNDCRLSPLGGGDINSAYHLQSTEVSWFIKVNRPTLAFMFEAEAQGLNELAKLKSIRVPTVITYGQSEQYSFLVLEHIELGGLRSDSAALLGEQLAALHKHRQAFFGWHCDNTIGSTAQHNERHKDWVEFWRAQRLLKQLQFAADNGHAGKLLSQGEKLAEKLDVFFETYQPQPALLHGDLWGGNAAADRQGRPVIYDPACYYGDREADIAMTELFGGFGADFYRAYQESYPLDSGYKTRKILYNLYHILNHLNLFGSAYRHQAETMIEQLLAET